MQPTVRANQMQEESHMTGELCKECNQRTCTVVYRSPRVKMDVESALRVVIERLEYAEFKEKQKKTIVSFTAGKDDFVSLPTGYGKSLCYQCLPVLFDTLSGHHESTSIIVVVTPLVAIMKEQVSELAKKGLSAVHVTPELDEMVESALMDGKFSVVYISPEQLLGRVKWREMLHSDVFQKNLVGFIIDEAHCVKKW